MNAALSFGRSFGFLIVLAAIYILFSLMAPSFFGVANLISVLHVVAPLIIVASGMALVVISGRLEVGSIAYVASATFTILMRDGGLPVMGALSDKVGRRPLLLVCTSLALVSAYPAMSWLVRTESGTPDWI